MTNTMHPPANHRCQIYGNTSVRCINEGTHWEKWFGCGCTALDHDVCEKDFFSWECDGPHRFGEVTAAFINEREAA